MVINVAQAQRLLVALGYDIAVDGYWGAKSQAAMDDACEKHGATVSKTETAKETSKTVTFWDGIRYFTRAEFACKCGGKYCNGFPAEPNETLIKKADAIREHFGKPAKVSSGVRCGQHNAAVGGVANSYHTKGRAMDFAIQGVSGASLLAYVKTQGVRYAYQIKNSEYVHMDV